HVHAFGGELVEDAAPAGETEAGEEARSGVPIVLYPRPRVGERGDDAGIKSEPVDQPIPAALSEEPVAQRRSSRLEVPSACGISDRAPHPGASGPIQTSQLNCGYLHRSRGHGERRMWTI